MTFINTGFLSNFFSSKKGTIKPVVLVVLDGWGIAPASHGNAITQAQIPNMNYFSSNYPHTEVIASGESVGLPANEVGNSEVGHLTIGVGRVINESLVKINKAIQDGTFYENEAIVSAIRHVKDNGSTLHLMGMTSSGNVHASMSHLYALIEACQRHSIEGVAIHAFTDGRDSAPNDSINALKELTLRLGDSKTAYIASVSGRYYAMDRDARWERTGAVYKMLTTGTSEKTYPSVDEALTSFYKEGITDEFVPPTLITNDGQVTRIKPGDAVIFFNFRIDRPRQLTAAFVSKKFDQSVNSLVLDQNGDADPAESHELFDRGGFLENLFFVTMTEYQRNIPVSAIAFPSEVVDYSLARSISEAGLKQLHLAESEKERMVTYYFDGLKSERFNGETVRIVPSPKVPTYDLKPEMSVRELTQEFVKGLRDDTYNFIVLNIANPDMVAHSGNIEATIRACQYTDQALGVIITETLKRDGCVFITADHGNAEELLTFDSGSFFFTTKHGSTNTEHSNNPVPFVIISKQFEGKPVNLPKGSLSDVAPTILSYMNIPVPGEMTGRNLLESLLSEPAKV